MLFRGASAATSPKPWFLKTRQRSSLAFHFPLLGNPQEIHLRNSSARLVDSRDRIKITRSLRFRLCHWVYVPPTHNWGKERQRATNCGARLLHDQVLASTEDLLSTSGWRELVADFAAGPQTRLIAIKVRRVPGNPLIKGTF